MRQVSVLAQHVRLLALLIVMAMVGPLTLGAPSPVVAGGGQTLTVNNTEAVDDGDCDSNDCSFLDAVGESNGTPGVLDKIAFDIPGGGVQTINVSNVAVNDAVVIDGYTQDGAKPNTLKQGTNAKIRIEFNTALAGLVLNQGPTTIRGIKFRGNDTCVTLNATADENVIEGNEFGDDDPNQGCAIFAILIQSGSVDNRIGGAKPAQRNFIVNSGLDDENQGIDGAAVKIFSNDNTITNNLFGTERDGNGCEPNISAIEINNGNNNLTTKNRFCVFFGGAGVAVFTGNENKISRNSIFLVDEFGSVPGIIVGGGANNGQDPPQLDSAETAGKTTTIKGQLTSTANTQFVIEFFSSSPEDDNGDPLFNDDIADKFIGKKNVTTNGGGVANFTFKTKKKVPDGRLITATATDPNGNTSDIANAVAVT
jgi:hypothetical protein